MHNEQADAERGQAVDQKGNDIIKRLRNG